MCYTTEEKMSAMHIITLLALHLQILHGLYNEQNGKCTRNIQGR